MDKLEKALLFILLLISMVLILYPQVSALNDAQSALSQIPSEQAELMEPARKALNNSLLQLVGFIILFAALILALKLI